eukprot:gene1646-29894_t
MQASTGGHASENDAAAEPANNGPLEGAAVVTEQQLRSVLSQLITEGCWPPATSTSGGGPTAAEIETMESGALAATSPQSVVEAQAREAFGRYSEVETMQQEANDIKKEGLDLKKLLKKLLTHGLGSTIDEATLKTILDGGVQNYLDWMTLNEE